MKGCEDAGTCWCAGHPFYEWGRCLPLLRWADDGSQVMTSDLADWENEGGSVNG